MKILLTTFFFHPSLGGVQTVSRLLAGEFVSLGHEVRVVTATREVSAEVFPFGVIRHPSFWRLPALVRWCDVLLQMQVSLRLGWPLALFRRPWVVAHHGWTRRVSGRRGWRDRLKHRLFRRAAHIAVSRVLADDLDVAATVIGNPYDAAQFRRLAGTERQRELVFLGRLVSQKGLDLLLQAVARLKTWGVPPRLTVIGDGPERLAMMGLASELDIAGQVDFVGEQTGVSLAALLNVHQILVVPSRIPEPFGVVALEGIACGCVPVVADGSGLPEAIGPCGIAFSRGNAEALAGALAGLLREPSRLESYRRCAAEHLQKFQPATVAREYLKVLEQAVGRHRAC